MSEHNSSSTLIFGAGAIGQWLGALLFSAGNRVQLHGRPGMAEIIKKQGGIVIDGARPVDVPFTYDIGDIQNKKFDTVIVTVKTYAVEAALKDLAEANTEFNHLISFQNGWGTEEHYLHRFPDSKFWALTTTRAVGVEKHGHLTPSSKGGLAVASWNEELRPSLPECLRTVKIPLVRLERGVDLKWSKLLLNIIGNATGAVTGLSPNHLANHPDVMRTEMLLTREALAVGRAMGIRRADLPSFPIRSLSVALEKLPLKMVTPIISAKMRRARGDKLPSLFFDLEDPTSPTEIDSMNGAIVLEGERVGVPTPKQKALVDLFHLCRRDSEVWKSIRQQPVRLMEYV